MILGFASLVLGLAAASVARTVAAAGAAGRAAGRAFSSGFGTVRAGMARTTTWVRSSFGRMGAAVGLFRSRISALSPTMNSFSRGMLASTRNMFRYSRAVSSVAGAFQGSNGLWYVMRNGRRVLNMQRHQVTQTITAWGRLANVVGQSTSIFSGFLSTNTGAIAAGVVALAPILGAALGAAIAAAVGIGVMAAGIAIAAKQSDRVQAAFASTFKPIGKELAEFATVAYEAPLIASAARFKQMWVDVGDDVKSALQKAAAFVKPMTEGVAQFIENAVGGGGFSALLDTAGPIITKLSTMLSVLGDAVNDMFQDIADAGPGLTKGLTAAFYVLVGLIRILGFAIQYLSMAFDTATETAQYLADAVADAGAAAGIALPAWQWAADVLGAFNDSANHTTSITPIMGTAAAMASEGFYGVAAAVEQARRNLIKLTEAIYGLISAQLGADQANLAFKKSLLDVSDAISKNGKTIDDNTRAGQANIEVVQEAVANALRAREAAIKLAGGEKASTEAVYAANAAFSAQIGQLEATLRAAGLTKAQIDALLGKYREMANAPNITKSVTVTHTTYFREVGGPNYAKAPGTNIAYASGTNYAKAGVALVGEHGPELVRFDGGEEVKTASETAALLAGAKDISKGSAWNMASLGKAQGGVAVLAPPDVRVYIGNEEIKDYVVKVSDERADARTSRLSHRLVGR